MPQHIQPYPQQQQQESMVESISKQQESLEVSPVIVPSMSPVTDIPLYYYYYYLQQHQALPRTMVSKEPITIKRNNGLGMEMD
jgi:hypothetical protein